MARLDGKRSGTVIFDDLAFKLTPSERIIFGIVHRYSGYALGECRLKPSRIAEIAGVSRSTVYNVINHLRELGMIKAEKRDKASGAKFTVLLVVRDRLDEEPVQSAEVIETRELENLDQGRHDETREHGNATVNDLFAFWLQEVDTPLTSRVKANRRAAWNLATKHSEEELTQMIKLVRVARFSDFAPHIADFVDLQSKWSQLKLWAEKRANAALMKKYEEMSIENRVKFREENPQLATIIDDKRRSL